MRLFVALNLTDREKARAYKGSEALRNADLPVRWIEADKYHITLKFLGNTDARRVEGIVEIVDRVCAATDRFSAEMKGFGAFPTLRRPRVLWLRVDPTPALRCLKQDLEWGLAELGYERETRAFHPHLTLGRASESGGAGAFRGLDELAASLRFRQKLTVKSVELMRSHLSKSGARYSVLHSSDLGKASSR